MFRNIFLDRMDIIFYFAKVATTLTSYIPLNLPKILVYCHSSKIRCTTIATLSDFLKRSAGHIK